MIDARATAPSPQDQALFDLLDALRASGYDFVVPTPSTHSRVGARLERSRVGSLRDALGWIRPFASADIPQRVVDALRSAGALKAHQQLLRSTVRVASLDGRLFLHSAPTADRDAVFLGPDSYRFVRFVRGVVGGGASIRRALDIGSGAGAGAITLAAHHPEAEVIGLDINAQALRLMAINARHARVAVRGVLGDRLDAVDGLFDLIIANPPYIAGSGGRVYRDGGADRGVALGLDWVRQAVPRLEPGGRIVLYTGSPIVEGEDVVKASLREIAEAAGMTLAYDEIDPDIFGGTLARDAYRDVERIAAIGAVLERN